jgi:nucleotide-binding universal stress UspA family protein
MYKNFLITTDGSDLAQRGVEHGTRLAAEAGAKVTIMIVTERFPTHGTVAGLGIAVEAGDLDAWKAARDDYATGVLGKARALADELKVPAEVVHVPGAAPAESIVEVATDRGCDLIVMASHGRRGIGRLLLGSQASEVLALSKVPVLIVR